MIAEADAQEPEPEPEPDPEPADDEPKPRIAVCMTCGNVIENVLPDALPEDVKFQCCDTPEYEIKED